MKMLNDAGLHVAAIDLEGHGLSEGVHGHIGNMDEHNDNFIQFLENLTQGTLYDKKFTSFDIFGHSLGGSLTANLIVKSYELMAKYNVKNYVISCPMYFTREEAQRYFFDTFVQIFDAIPLKGLPLQNLSYRPNLSDNVMAEADWLNNPLVRKPIINIATAREFLNLFNNISKYTNREIETAVEYNQFKLTVIGAGHSAIPSWQMGFELYKKFKTFLKDDRIQYIDWRNRSHEPWNYADYNNIVLELVNILKTDAT